MAEALPLAGFAPLRRSLLFLLRAVLPVCLLCPGPDGARAQDAAGRQLAGVLSGYEGIPGEAYWRARGPETVAALQALFDDEQQPGFVRLRAVRAASFYRTPRARSFLLEVARKPGQKDLFIREALLGLGRAFGEQAAGEIAPFLDHDRALVRRTAVETLAEIKAQPWRSRLEQRLQKETDPGVRAALQQVLERSPDRVQAE